MADAEFAQRPDSVKKLRACKTCKLIKTYDQFKSTYCENCPFTHPDSDNAGSDYVDSSTTADFEGLVSLMQPKHSWVARWLKMRGVDDDGAATPFLPGLYAISLPGVEAELAAADAKAVRDGDDEYEEDVDDDEGEAGAGAGGAAAAAQREPDDDAAASEPGGGHDDDDGDAEVEDGVGGEDDGEDR